MGQSFVYNTGSSEDLIATEKLHLNFGVFIDGTLNNMYNTDLRTKYGRGGATGKPDESLTNAEIEKKEEKLYKEVPDKKRIEELLKIENRDYHEQRELENYPENDVYLVAAHRDMMDKMGTDNSYSNDHTNVARLWSCCDEEYKIYVEGMGSSKSGKDDQDGFAFGAGSISGIRARVREACEKMAKKIKKLVDQKQNEEKKLTQITLDVFGFSRGAAAARNFVAEVNYKNGVYPATKSDQYNYKKDNSKTAVKVRDNIPQQSHGVDTQNRDFSVNAIKKEIKNIYKDRDGQEVNALYIVEGKMPRFGHLGISLLKNGIVKKPEELEEITVIVRFLGIYDTVSSYGEVGPMGGDSVKKKGVIHLVNSYFQDDEAELNLQNMGRIQKIVHFTAKDEHRENFALTRVDQKYSSKNYDGSNKLVEINLPGVHCDIGGAYLNEPETISEIETTAFLIPKTATTVLQELKNIQQELIDNYWFKEDQIKIINPVWYYPAKVVELFSRLSPYFMTTYLARQAAYHALTSERKVHKEYSYIPLHFMEEYFRNYITQEQMPDSVLRNYSLSGFPILKQAKAHIEKHVLQDHKEWEFISDEKLKILKINEQTDVLINENRLNESGQKSSYDHLNPNDYKPNTRLELEKIPGLAHEPKYTVEDLSSQSLLRILRNQYFHWSSNRDWFGMDQSNDRVRVEYPKK